MKSHLKIAGRRTLVGIEYALLYLGANDALWPRIAHFHHHDWQVPALADGAISSVVLPILVACFLAATREEDGRWVNSFPWVLLFTPLALLVFFKYVADALYPPFWGEALSLVLVGALQGLSASAGWFFYHALVRPGVHP